MFTDGYRRQGFGRFVVDSPYENIDLLRCTQEDRSGVLVSPLISFSLTRHDSSAEWFVDCIKPVPARRYINESVDSSSGVGDW